jgi:hypothetical protein
MSKKLTHSEFINKAINKHGNKYSYSKSIYINTDTKILINCVKCNKDFWQTPHMHLLGNGCPDCGRSKSIKSRTFNKQQFILQAIKEHGDKYSYINIKYKNFHTQIEIYCNICQNSFFQAAHSHLAGRGCPKCAAAKKAEKFRLGIELFIKYAIKIHKDKYSYTNVEYKNCNTKVRIFCNKCKKEFLQTPGNHLSGHGCPFCVSTVSKPSQKWLDSFNNPNIIREKSIKIGDRRFRPDGIDLINKIIYELNGSFWHGNPKFYNRDDINPITKTTYGYLYQKTIEKKEYLEKHGYIVISIWDNDLGNNGSI